MYIWRLLKLYLKYTNNILRSYYNLIQGLLYLQKLLFLSYYYHKILINIVNSTYNKGHNKKINNNNIIIASLIRLPYS
jgi:hypothetical protein